MSQLMEALRDAIKPEVASLVKEGLEEVLHTVISEQMQPSFEALAHLTILERKKMLNPKEVSELYGLTEYALSTMRSRGGGPAYHQIDKGFPVYYSHEDISRWFKNQRKLM